MKTWSYIWATLAIVSIAATVCGYNWTIIPAAICALMYVACTVEREEAEEDTLWSTNTTNSTTCKAWTRLSRPSARTAEEPAAIRISRGSAASAEDPEN